MSYNELFSNQIIFPCNYLPQKSSSTCRSVSGNDRIMSYESIEGYVKSTVRLFLFLNSLTLLILNKMKNSVHKQICHTKFSKKCDVSERSAAN